MDELIQEYSDRLDRIYTERTAGDHTFYGLLSLFARDVLERVAEETYDVSDIREM